jgi:hypothetical protein
MDVIVDLKLTFHLRGKNFWYSADKRLGVRGVEENNSYTCRESNADCPIRIHSLFWLSYVDSFWNLRLIQIKGLCIFLPISRFLVRLVCDLITALVVTVWCLNFSWK